MNPTFLQATAMVALAAAFCGCETTGDPNSGGIFWSETKARQRLAEDRAQLGQARTEAASEQARTAALKNRRAAAQSTLARQRRELADLKADIAALKQQIAQGPAATQALKVDVDQVERKQMELSADDALTVAEKERELTALRADVDRLRTRNKLLRE